MRRVTFLISILALLPATASVGAKAPTQGCLTAIGPEAKPLGRCPLQHTDVQVFLSGTTAYVQVEQVFENPYDEKIEAIYTFPLGSDAAVSEMTMEVGDRVIFGRIKPRDEARQIYEEAKEKGHVASLLAQERPNIFTQAVANIEPGKKITITIGYTETLTYNAGRYEFVFPMVVGPRYIPGDQPGPTPSPGEPQPLVKPRRVPAEQSDDSDADRISPPITPKGIRAGHDISVTVMLNPGVKIQQIDAPLHEIDLTWQNPAHTRAKVSLANKDEIPNKDFVLRFETASDDIADAMLTHTDQDDGYFTLLLQPPARPAARQVVAREIMFVVDTSGSQRGFPLSLSQQICLKAIENLRPGDKFNVMQFANSAGTVFEGFVENDENNRNKAGRFIRSLKGQGGTRMAGAMNACLTGEAPEGMVRIVAFFTDGFVGNDMEMIDIVRENAAGTRVFVFGTGKSVNRYCIDGIAQAGRGEAEYVLQEKGAQDKADSFYNKIDAPVLTDISIDWGKLESYIVADELYPRVIPDLFSAKPVVIKGRFRRPEKDVTATLILRGTSGGGDFSREIQVTLPAKAPGNPVLPKQWARAKVDHLMASDLRGMQQGNPDEKIKAQIIDLGQEYGLMTRFTSFVAVEEKTVTLGGKPRKVHVPVEMPDGVSYEGIFGDGNAAPVNVRGRRMIMQGMAAGGAKPAPTGPAANRLKQATGRKGQAPARGATKAAEKVAPVENIPEDADRDDEATQEPLSKKQMRERAVKAKVAEALQDLQAKLDEKGNYAQGKVIVTDGKVEIAIYLTDLSPESLAKIKDLGFEKLLEAPAARMVLGSVEVERLPELAMLSVVRSIDVPNLAD